MRREDGEIYYQALAQARLNLKLGINSEARYWAHRALAICPHCEDPWLLLAAVGSPRASLDYLEEALRIHPESRRAQQGILWARNRLIQSASPTQANIYSLEVRSTNLVLKPSVYIRQNEFPRTYRLRRLSAGALALIIILSLLIGWLYLPKLHGGELDSQVGIFLDEGNTVEYPTDSSTVPQAMVETGFQNEYYLDPIFRSFYLFLGGEGVLGKVISDAKIVDGVTLQYTENCLMVFDLSQPETSRFQLSPLGRQLGFGWKDGDPATVGVPFRELYDHLGGQGFVGKPITGMFYNQEKNRYEQYFENLGFYLGEDSGMVVHLLPYGAWMCGYDCRVEGLSNAIVSMPTLSAEPTWTENNQQQGQSEIVIQVQTMNYVTPQQKPLVAANIQENGQPLEGKSLQATIILPDGNQSLMWMPPTDQSGTTRLEIEPIDSPIGSIIQLKICYPENNFHRFCATKEFMIWSNP